MKRLKKLKGWGIYQNNKREIAEHGFEFSVIHPETMECYEDSGLTPSDTDWECETLEQAISWVENY